MDSPQCGSTLVAPQIHDVSSSCFRKSTLAKGIGGLAMALGHMGNSAEVSPISTSVKLIREKPRDVDTRREDDRASQSGIKWHSTSQVAPHRC